jgi:hypothetical protein
MVVRHLRQAVHQQLAFHLVADLLFESLLDQLAWGAARAKARQFSLRRQLVERVLEVAGDILLGDRHRHVPFASARRGDLDLQRHPRLLGRDLFRLVFAVIDFGGAHEIACEWWSEQMPKGSVCCKTRTEMATPNSPARSSPRDRQS